LCFAQIKSPYDFDARGAQVRVRPFSNWGTVPALSISSITTLNDYEAGEEEIGRGIQLQTGLGQKSAL
jgi:hypothetical protein